MIALPNPNKIQKDVANIFMLGSGGTGVVTVNQIISTAAFLEDKNLIAFKYCNEKGKTNRDSNPNGSLNNIAGIFNENKNILGMMPHPERMIEKSISGDDGINLFSSLLN